MTEDDFSRTWLEIFILRAPSADVRESAVTLVQHAVYTQATYEVGFVFEAIIVIAC